jgi:hypothetical protein
VCFEAGKVNDEESQDSCHDGRKLQKETIEPPDYLEVLCECVGGIG